MRYLRFSRFIQRQRRQFIVMKGGERVGKEKEKIEEVESDLVLKWEITFK